MKNNRRTDLFDRILSLSVFDFLSEKCTHKLKYVIGNYIQGWFENRFFADVSRRIVITSIFADMFSTFDYKVLYTNIEKDMIDKPAYLEIKSTVESDEKYDSTILINQIQHDKVLKTMKKERFDMYLIGLYNFFDNSFTLYDYKKVKIITENMNSKYSDSKKILLDLYDAYIETFDDVLDHYNRENIRHEQYEELKKHLKCDKKHCRAV